MLHNIVLNHIVYPFLVLSAKGGASDILKLYGISLIRVSLLLAYNPVQALYKTNRPCVTLVSYCAESIVLYVTLPYKNQTGIQFNVLISSDGKAVQYTAVPLDTAIKLDVQNTYITYTDKADSTLTTINTEILPLCILWTYTGPLINVYSSDPVLTADVNAYQDISDSTQYIDKLLNLVFSTYGINTTTCMDDSVLTFTGQAGAGLGYVRNVKDYPAIMTLFQVPDTLTDPDKYIINKLTGLVAVNGLLSAPNITGGSVLGINVSLNILTDSTVITIIDVGDSSET